MTTITVKINERNKAGKAFLAYIKKQEGIEIVQEKKPKPDKKKLDEIVSKINKTAAKRMLQTHNIKP